MTFCPNSYESGCRCVEHAAGLLAHSPDAVAYLKALRQADADKQRHLAAVQLPERVNTYHGDKPQPWEPRAPRHLREAA